MNDIRDLLPNRMRERTFQLKAKRDAGAVWHEPQFVECKQCGRRAARTLWGKSLYVCPNCGYHMPIGGYYRLSLVLDHGSFRELDADLARIKAETLPIPTGIQTALAEHYQALLHTNDFYQYLTLFKELGQKQTQQQSRGRKINAMDTYFYQMVERVLREELAVAFGESQQEAGRRLLEILR